MRVNSFKCDTCIHASVCKYTKESNNLYDKLQDVHQESEVFNVSLMCDNYQKEKDWSTRI